MIYHGVFAGSPCFKPANNAPYSILPAQAGSLLSLAQPEVLPPSEPPAPALTVANVVDPPLPSINKIAPARASGTAGTSSSQTTVTINMTFSLVMVVLSFMSLKYH